MILSLRMWKRNVLNSVLRKFDNTVKKIEAKKFDAKPSWLCNYCEYAYICDMIYDETMQDEFSK